ncbi:MAG TPA: histidine phosphatase family protein [Mesorhizobium sp.]
MSRLYLVRHAKAGWAMPGVRDFDRPLDASGIADAETLGAAMRAGRHVPDLTICSNALRARETLAGLAANADTGRVVFTDVLYSGDANSYLATIRENGARGSLLLIGHNPMMEDLALAVSGDGDETARATLAYGFPTCGLAAIRFEGSLGEARLGSGYLEVFLTPAEM